MTIAYRPGPSRHPEVKSHGTTSLFWLCQAGRHRVMCSAKMSGGLPEGA